MAILYLSLKVCFQWVSNPVTDMYADSVVTVILRAERDPMPQKSKYSVRICVT